MGRIKQIQYDCRKATYLIEKGQQTSLSLGERVRLVIHLAGCSVCRLFRRQSRLINRVMRSVFRASVSSSSSASASASAGRRVLDEGFKREMQEKIEERMPR